MFDDILEDIVNGGVSVVENKIDFGGYDVGKDYYYNGVRVGTLVHFAALKGQCEVLDMLLEREVCDVNFQDEYGETPLIACFKYESQREYDSNVHMFSKLFWEHKADPNIADKLGNTAVHYAAKSYYKMQAALHDMVRKDHVDLWKKNKHGFTPLDIFLRDEKIGSAKREIITKIMSRAKGHVRKERKKFQILVDGGLLLEGPAKQHCEPCIGQEILAPSSVQAFMKQMARIRNFHEDDDEYYILDKIYPRMKQQLQDFINEYGNPADFDFSMP